MLNDNGKVISSALPSTPVQVSGWKELPEAGEPLLEVASEVREKPSFCANLKCCSLSL